VSEVAAFSSTQAVGWIIRLHGVPCAHRERMTFQPFRAAGASRTDAGDLGGFRAFLGDAHFAEYIKINMGGNFTVLHNFVVSHGPWQIQGGLISDTAGNRVRGRRRMAYHLPSASVSMNVAERPFRRDALVYQRLLGDLFLRLNEVCQFGRSARIAGICCKTVRLE
jgi:hypothetical protein